MGKKMGTTIKTIGTHSSGHPSKKIKNKIKINITMGGRGREVRKLAIKSALPSLENTDPNRFEVVTNSRIMLETRKVCMTQFLILTNVMRPDIVVSKKVATQPTAPASVGVAMPARITPKVANKTTITGAIPIIKSIKTGLSDFARISRGSAGPKAGLIQQRIMHQEAKRKAKSRPGKTAAANKSVAGIPTTGPMTINITEGGIRMPNVPPAVIAPADMRTSYPLLIMDGAAITPSKTTDEPTMPVAAAKIVAVTMTAR